MKPYRRHAVLAASLATIVVAALAAPADDSSDKDITYIIQLDGEINLGTSSFLRRSVIEAERLQARAIVVEINTFGGRVDSATEIRDALIGTDIKTIAYVNKRAISAGALIALACQSIVMAPGSTIGAATPVMMGPGMAAPLPTGEKEVSYMRTEFRSTAEHNGYPPLLAEAMVDPDAALAARFTAEGTELFEIDMPAVAVPNKPEQVKQPESMFPFKLPTFTPEETVGRYLWSAISIDDLNADDKVVIKRGKLLTLTADDAALYGLTTYTADSLKTVLTEFGLQNTRLVYARIKWSERMAGFLTNPVVSGLLLTFGFLGILYELKMPGWGVSGTFGFICLALFFGAHYLAGFANWFEVILFLVGIGLLAAEIFVIPGFGVAGVSGILCIVASLYLALVKQFVPQYEWDMADVNRAVWTLIAWVITFILALALSWKILARTPLYAGIVQVNEERADRGFTMPSAGQQDLVGLEGIATTILRPTGRARLGDKTHTVIAEGEFIEKGTPVRVAEVKGNRIVVVRVEDVPVDPPADERT